jgi:hypothetical protein
VSTAARAAASLAAIRLGMELTRWSDAELWRAVLSVGGGFDPARLAGITAGERVATSAEHDVLAAAFNDRLRGDGPGGAVRYWAELDDDPDAAA